MSEVGLFLLSTVKFFLAPPAGIALGFSYFKTLGLTISGGITGVWFFYYFGKLANKMIQGIRPKSEKFRRGPKKKFTFTNKLIVRLKLKLGITGLAMVSPILISIPLGSIIASKYFKKSTTPFYFAVWVVVWAFALTGVSSIFREYIYSAWD